MEVVRVCLALDRETDDEIERRAALLKLSKSGYVRAILSRAFETGIDIVGESAGRSSGRQATPEVNAK